LNPNGEITMDDLLRDAIADAKAVRETALENAKIALEEAFTPRLQSMLSKKIAAEMEDKEEEEDSEEMREEEDSDEGRHDADEEKHDAEEMRHDADEMRHDAEEMRNDAEEMKHDAEEMDHDAEEMAHDKEEEEDSDEMREEEDAEEGEDEEEGMREEEDAEEDDELDLESVLAELEADLSEEEDKDEEDKVDESEDKEEEEKVDENDVSSDIGKSDNKLAPAANDSSKIGQGPEGEGKDEPAGNELDDHEVVKENEDKEEEEMDEDLDLDEVLKALSEEEDAEEEADKVDELKKEIKETREVVKFMRAKLNEVNLLNAKLLFSNKLFRAFGLNNDQKLKVVENFDRTTNLREVKLVYATLAESFQKPSKLSESVKKGSSSKPVASTKPSNKEVLSEGAELKARFKKLANIL
jgi:hypothetical protein